MRLEEVFELSPGGKAESTVPSCLKYLIKIRGKAYQILSFRLGDEALR